MERKKKEKLVLTLHYLWWISAKSTKSRVSGSGVTASWKWAFHRKGKKQKKRILGNFEYSSPRSLTCCSDICSNKTCSMSVFMKTCHLIYVLKRNILAFRNTNEAVKLLLKPFVTCTLARATTLEKTSKSKRHAAYKGTEKS